jgi:hypothetical protein
MFDEFVWDNAIWGVNAAGRNHAFRMAQKEVRTGDFRSFIPSFEHLLTKGA